MKVTTNLTKGELLVNGAVLKISCNVRTVCAGTRRSNEVVESIPGKQPYDPRPFPKGIWDITAVEWQSDYGFDKSVYGTVKIRTNAWQYVKVWELDKDGDYLHETDRKVIDSGYLIHYSDSNTTLGCIRSERQDVLEIAARIIENLLKQGEAVQLEVI